MARSMYNILEQVKGDPVTFRQLALGPELLTEFNCPLENALQDLWSHENYFVHMLEGRKGWYAPDGELLLNAGETAFARKGATLIRQYLDQASCVVLFFVSDAFICETLRSMGVEKRREPVAVPPIVRINPSLVLHGFFQGMLAHFHGTRPSDELLRLKFRELLLSVINDPKNGTLMAHFCSLLNDPVRERVRRVMEDNYCFNLELSELARLSGRSLAAFKRDVQEVFGMPPGRWIRQRRLERARTLLAAGDLQVGEVAFQCGFENLSHFSRTFKEVHGVAPAALRTAAEA